MGERELDLLYEKAIEFGIKLSQYHTKLLHLYLNELESWNRRMNLSGITSRKRIIYELFLDSLISTSFIPKKGKMLDVGSGAGFPAIPIKIINPSLNIHLIEPNSKKVSFLKQIIRILNLNDIEVKLARIENYKDVHNQGSYDIITSRAYAPLDKTISSCSTFLASNGSLVCFLGSQAKEDLLKCQKQLKDHSLKISKIFPYTLPGKKTMRYDVIFKKRNQKEE